MKNQVNSCHVFWIGHLSTKNNWEKGKVVYLGEKEKEIISLKMPKQYLTILSARKKEKRLE